MKFKEIPKSYIKVILDRLFRFKPAHERYERVFNDILNKFLIAENDEISKIHQLDLQEKINLATEIFNSNISPSKDDKDIKDYIKNEEKRIFHKNELSDIYLEAKLNYKNALDIIKDEPDLKDNLRQIVEFSLLKEDSKKLRKKHSLLFPIEKILLCEGATEEILLEKLCKICGYDFRKEGIYVLGAGGKNQVARKYYNMAEVIKIPIFILLDSDAIQTKELIESKLKPKDKIYIIQNGEFEDILPKKLIINALNCRYNSCLECFEEDFHKNTKTAKELYEIFKQKGFGDFKKADFAKTIKEYIDLHPPKKDELTDEIIKITHMIKTL